MHHVKNRGYKEIPLAILSRILAQSCVTPLPELCREGLHMIVLVSLIVLLGGFPCFHDFSSNDFVRSSAYKRSYAHAYMRRLARAAL